MSTDVVGIDPEAARDLAAAMRRARDGWQDYDDELATIGAAGALSDELAAARGALANAAGDVDLAADSLYSIAALAEAIDGGDSGLELSDISLAVNHYWAAWEAGVEGGPDGGEITVTVSSWEDFEERFTGFTGDIPGWLCASNSWYSAAGGVVGPDGRVYPISLPHVRNTDADDDDDPFEFNADWGQPEDGRDVWTLDGLDQGWSTVAVETGAGQTDQLSPFEAAMVALSGQAGNNYLGADGLTPVPLDAYGGIVYDEYWVPAALPGVDPDADVLLPPEGTDEVSGATPVLVQGANGSMRYETTVTASPTVAVSAAGAALVTGIAVGQDNVSQVNDGSNIAYVVEYQENAEGDTRAIVRAYHIEVNDDGEPQVFMSYLGLNGDGEVAPMAMVSPRVGDDYTPVYTTNGFEPE